MSEAAPAATAIGAAPAREAKTKPGPLEYMRQWPLRVNVDATLLFLYLPLITLMAFSFNTQRRNIVWQGFTTDWYAKAFNDYSLMQAFTNSLTIAAICTVVSVILGALAAVLLWRFKFPGKTALEGGMALPIVVPEICMGVAMLVFFARVFPWPQGLPWPPCGRGLWRLRYRPGCARASLVPPGTSYRA